MTEKLMRVTDYFRKIPVAFLIAIIFVLGLILFLPSEIAKTLAIDKFRDTYRVFLGPTFLLTVAFLGARIFTSLMKSYSKKQYIKIKQESLYKLTPEEKGYLVPYIKGQKNTIYVGIDDGIMNGLVAKKITYRAANMGNLLEGIAFNLQPWAREYLEENPHLLNGYQGQPMTPQQKLHSRW